MRLTARTGSRRLEWFSGAEFEHTVPTQLARLVLSGRRLARFCARRVGYVVLGLGSSRFVSRQAVGLAARCKRTDGGWSELRSESSQDIVACQVWVDSFGSPFQF